MTTKEIQQLVGKMQVLKFHSPVCENVSNWISNWEFDVLSVSKSDMVYEFEIKISRADFKADIKKKCRYYNDNGITLTKHEYYADPRNHISTPNYYSYVCPDGLIKLAEVPLAAGLYYVVDGELVEKRRPKRLHKHIHDRTKLVEKICRLTSERLFLGGARMTFENRNTATAYDKYIIKELVHQLKLNQDKLIELCQQHGINDFLYSILVGANNLLAREGKIPSVDLHKLFPNA
jgi:hypothetical protein